MQFPPPKLPLVPGVLLEDDKSRWKRFVRSPRGSVHTLLHKGRFRVRIRHVVASSMILYYLLVLHRWYPWFISVPVKYVECDMPAGLEDVFVMVRTGATEVRQKLPAQLETGLSCLPSYALFSDIEEDVLGQHTYDALSEITAPTKAQHPEFALYRSLSAKGPENLTADDYILRDASRNNGHPSNAGWVLDKWKFIPLLEKGWNMHPESKWFFMMELDAYVSWPNLVRFLAQFDPLEPRYIGSVMAIGGQSFAHGGGGIIISNAAARKFLAYYSSHREEVEKFVADQWAGDFALGKVMADAGVQVKDSWPLQQIHSASGINYARENRGRIWCAPVLTYHHMGADEIIGLRHFEKEWKRANITGILRHRDVFEYYILPRITSEKEHWDNFAGEGMKAEEVSEMTKEKCLLACRMNSDCMQYSFEAELCRFSSVVHLGRPVTENSREISSGWMRDRIMHYFHHTIEPCAEGEKKNPFQI